MRLTFITNIQGNTLTVIIGTNTWTNRPAKSWTTRMTDH